MDNTIDFGPLNNKTPFVPNYPPKESQWLGRVVKTLFLPLYFAQLILKKVIISFTQPFLFGFKHECKRMNPILRGQLEGAEIQIKTSDERIIEGRYIETEGATKTVILFTGSHQSYEYYAKPYVNAYKEMKFNILLVNYAGYGRSEGNTSEETLKLDAEAAYEYVRQAKSTNEDKIRVHGYSLGSYPATYLASRHDVEKLVIDRGFSKISKVAYDTTSRMHKILGAIAFLFIEFTQSLSNQSLIKQVNSPIVLIRGEQDTTMRKHHVDTLYSRVQDQELVKKVDLDIDHHNEDAIDWLKDL